MMADSKGDSLYNGHTQANLWFELSKVLRISHYNLARIMEEIEN